MAKNTYYGFNFLWMYSADRPIQEPDEKALDFMNYLGLNFVRIPTDYRFWTNGTDYLNPDYKVIEKLFAYFKACEKRNIHYCLNLHRAPGYCINNNDRETDNLWLDKTAQDGFVFLWETFAKRFKGISNDLVSFDLINEPPDVGQYGLTRQNHKQIIKRTVEAIWSIDPGRSIIIDGLGGGNLAMPELSNLPLIQSTRGYQPMALTHFQAEWCKETANVTEPTYPLTLWDEKHWDKSTLRDHYKPWLALQKKGVHICVGEFGCYNKIENRFALEWFTDLLSLYKEWKWGYVMWNFKGPFGIVEHGRPGTVYSNYNGYKVDKKLLDLYLENRIT